MKLFLTPIFLVFLLLTSCHSSHSNTKSCQRLRLVISEEPSTLDPRKGGDALSSHLHFMLFEGLIKLHGDGTTSPAQCTSFDISSDQKTYTFHLGQTKWSDGHPVTAYDFEKAWKAILSPSFPSPNAHLLYPISNAEAAKRGLVPLEEVGVYAPNAQTLIVKLSHPTPYFLNLISFCVFFPVPTHIESRYPQWAFQSGKEFVSNGPFMLETWRHNNELVLRKNEQYHQSNQVYLDTIHLSIIGSSTTAFQLYKNNEIDLIGEPFSSIPLDVQSSLKEKNEVIVSPSAATTFITFNTLQFPFSNKNLRKAFTLAINREVIAKNIARLEEKAAFCAVPPSLKKNLKTHLYSDGLQEEARNLFAKGLEELGISKKELETVLTYSYSQSEVNHKVAQVLQRQWHETLGVLVKLGVTDRKSHMDAISRKKHIFGQALYRAQYSDPINILDRFRCKENIKNYSSWENEKFQKLLELSFLQPQEERIQTLYEAEEILIDDAVIAPLFHLNLCYLAKPNISNMEFSPVGGIFLERLSLTPSD